VVHTLQFYWMEMSCCTTAETAYLVEIFMVVIMLRIPMASTDIKT